MKMLLNLDFFFACFGERKVFYLKVVKKCELFFQVLVKSFFSFQVSWMRHDDTQLLAIGRLTYTSDMRFKAIHKLYSEDYLLQIKPTTHRDSGKYTCQISTTPPISHIVTLTIAGMYSYKINLASFLFYVKKVSNPTHVCVMLNHVGLSFEIFT